MNSRDSPVTDITLDLATDNLNILVRYTSRSAKELYLSHNPNSGEYLGIVDMVVSGSYLSSQLGHFILKYEIHQLLQGTY